MNNQNIYTIWSYDAFGYAYVVDDAHLIKYSTISPGGFKNLTFSVDRDINRNYQDLGIGFMVRCVNTFGQIVWEGMLTNIERYQSQTNQFSLNISCLGYTTFLATQPEVLIAAGTAISDISYFVNQNINPMVSSNYFASSTVLTTGVNIHYQNAATILKGNAKTTVRGLLDKLFVYGDSSNNFMDWGVRENRAFYWLPRPTNYTLVASTQDADDVSIEWTNNQVYSTIEITYINKDTNKQTLLTVTLGAGTNYNYSSFDTINGVPVPILATQKVDLRGQGHISAAQATQAAQTMIKQLSLIKIVANDIKFSRATTVQDAVSGSYIPLGSIRAGNIILTPDIAQTDWSSMQSYGFNNIGNKFYIAETEYDVDLNQMTLKPEQGRDYQRVIERITSGSGYVDLNGVNG